MVILPEPSKLVLFMVLMFVPLTKLACLLLNVVQSDDVSAPLLVADALGTCKVITGVVVSSATVLDKSVPVVPIVNADTSVTVPPAPPPAASISISFPTVFNVMFVPADIVTSLLVC